MRAEKKMRSEKIQLFDDVACLLKDSSFIYFVSYKGLKTKDLSDFRDNLFKCGAQCHILKNRIVRKVAEANGMKALGEAKITGDTAVVLGNGDAGQVAKVIDSFAKSTKDVLKAKCGYIEGAMLSDADVKAIAGLPSKDQLRAQLLGLLVAVPTGLVRVLNAKVSSIVNVVNAYKNKLEESNKS